MLFLLPMYILYIYIHIIVWLSMSIYIDGRIYMHRFEYASICLYTQHVLTLYIYMYMYIYIYVFIYICIYSFCLHTLALMESGMYESVELRMCLFFVFFQSMHQLTICEGVNLKKPNRNDERTE
jgi:hypothetical protein